MKSAATLAAGVVAMASVAAAQSWCAVQCFQGVMADHPPLDCKEENMYLCFCKDASLQNYFIECAENSCSAQVDEVINFGIRTCAGYGVTLEPPVRGDPEPETTSAAPEPEPTTAAPPAEETTEAPVDPEPTTQAPPPVEETTEASAPAEETTAAAPVVPSGQTTVVVPTTSAVAGSATSSAAQPTPTVVEVNMGVSNAASNVLVAAGALVAAFQML